MGRMCEGICQNCDCGSDKIIQQQPKKTKEQIHLANMERAYRVLKDIADGGGSNPRIYAQNTIDGIKRGY
jgi:hypothetical protein